MTEVTNIGLPQLSAEDIENLTEECETEITRFIFNLIPEKSVSELRVICSIDLSETLTLDVELDVTQRYNTGHSLDDILEQAVEHAQAWLEQRLREMKNQ